MFGKLEDKVAIVTGAGQGIGAGIARVFADAGARVMVATRTAKHGEATVEAIEKAGGTAALCTVDIGELEKIERVVSETVEKWGGIDVIVHNVASFLGGPVERYSKVTSRSLGAGLTLAADLSGAEEFFEIDI